MRCTRKTADRRGFGAWVHAAVAGMVSVLAGSPAGADCQLGWSDKFALPGVQGRINAVTLWDDGTGPALYAAGLFYGIGNTTYSSFEDPNLISTVFIAKWDGTSWAQLGPDIADNADLLYFNSLTCMTEFDPDGPGPARSVLVVGGENSTGGQGVLQFNGTQWSRLGTGLPGSRVTDVKSLAVYDSDGDAGPNLPQLIAVGRMRATTATGLNAKYGIARWNGTTWTDLAGSCLESAADVLHAEVYNGELYVAGKFTLIGNPSPISVPGIAKWNGTAWSAVPGTIAGQWPVTMLKVVDMGDGPSLLVGGVRYAGLTQDVTLARYKDGVWSTLKEQGHVNDAAMFNGPQGPVLHIGGLDVNNASTSGIIGSGTNMLARQTTTGWEMIGSMGQFGVLTESAGNRPQVRCLFVTDWDFAGTGGEKLLIGGVFSLGGGGSHRSLMLWNGSAAEPVHSGSDALGFGGVSFGISGTNTATVRSMRVLDIDGAGPQSAALYIGGTFASAGTTPAFGIVRFDGSGYQPVGDYLTNGSHSSTFDVTDMVVFDAGDGATLYVGRSQGNGDCGSNFECGGATVARLKNNNWEPVYEPNGQTVINRLLTFTVNGEPSIVGFATATYTPDPMGRGIARWNGTAWSALDAGLHLSADEGVKIAQDAVVFNDGSGETMYCIYRTGDATGVHTHVASIFRWNNAQWEVFGNSTLYDDSGFLSTPPEYLDLAVHNGQLYAAGRFESINNEPGTGTIVRWTGTGWQSLGEFVNDAGGTASVNSMVWHDLGDGEKLYVRGQFSRINGEDAVGVAVMDETGWHPLAGTQGVLAGGSLFSVPESAPYAGLYFNDVINAGGHQAAGLARLEAVCTNPCSADFNNSGSVTVQDIFDFLGAWFAGASTADVNNSGSITVQDIFDFLGAWFQGC